jgi:hypothetical protein
VAKSARAVKGALTKISALIWRAARALKPTVLPLGRKHRSHHGEFKCVENGCSFVTFRTRPIYRQALDALQEFPQHPDTAIVIQGPIIPNFSFTLETVKLYRDIFPGSFIIVSTWNSESQTALDEIRLLGAHVVVSEPPSEKGLGSHNLQMLSSNAGLVHAESLGVKFAIKTRSDQRIYNPYSINLMKELVEQYPLTDEASLHQKGRVVSISLSSFAYRPFGLSDMLHFGAVSDLIKYWNGSLDNRSGPVAPLQSLHSTRDSAKQLLGEPYFTTNFLSSTGWNIEWTLENYWAACVERFIVIDASSIDLYWPKYSFKEERWKNYIHPVSHQEIDFAFWTSLRSGLRGQERIINLPEIELRPPLSRESDDSYYACKPL